ncbi:SRPBCC domain-containing protein [Streptomyces sp. NPDC101132]|uniref:SRPBCC domain-containing protein n=1 Tax=Streptomyces sp. NPDC101132 TaxID=3366110 RepID=UPI003829B101
MATSTSVIGHRTSTSRDGGFLIQFEVRLAHGYEQVWAAVSTAAGLRGWLARADVLERRLGGAVTLTWPGGGPTVHGRVTAWDVERVAEYTVTGYGRIRLHLESAGPEATLLRFTNERRGGDADRLDALAAWHEHFERLAEALDGHPVDWMTWTPDRRRELRAHYAAD